MKILLVEDDPLLSDILIQSLKAHRYTVEAVTDGAIAVEIATQFSFDLIVLDRQIPRLDGIQVCQQLREQGCQVPILMLTAQNSDEEIIQGLDAGADDYVTKPCQPSHLLARVRTLLRRRGNTQANTGFTWGDLHFDSNLIWVAYRQSTIDLSPKEYSLLELFLRNPQRIFSRGVIIDHLWSIDESPSDAAVTNLVKDLRRKLKVAGMQEEMIETVFRLGYRLKAPPLPQKEVSQEVSLSQSTEEEHNCEVAVTEINQIAEEYRTSLKQQVENFAATVRATDLLSRSQRTTLQTDAHRLAGGLGTVGYHQGSEIAREIEQLLMEDSNLGSDQQTQILQLVAKLKDVIKQPPIDQSPSLSLITDPTPATLMESSGAILLISDDRRLIETLQQAPLLQELQFESAANISAIYDRICQCSPRVVLLDITSEFLNQNGLSVLTELKQRFNHLPVLVLTAADCLDERVAVARRGGDGFLLKTVSSEILMQAISQAIASPILTEAKVLVVDDDAMMLKTMTALLQPWGFQVNSLSDPSQFWQQLSTVAPDLLLLDLEMPNFNGLDLCRVVRQDTRFSDLPILIVTAHKEPDKVQAVFAAGADDFINKPVAGPELVTRVLNRIERSRTQQQLMRFQPPPSVPQPQSRLIDPLTQIASIYQFDMVLNDQWQRSQQEHTPLSLILGNVDYFRLYNDHNGYPAGDRCLQRIAKALQACLTSERELVARYAGETFAILLPGSSLGSPF